MSRFPMSIYGTILSLFYTVIIASTIIHGDFHIMNGSLSARIPDINLLLQAMTGVSLMLSPLNRKLFGTSALVSSSTSLIITVGFGETTENILIGATFVLISLVSPSLYILMSSDDTQHIFHRRIIAILLVISVSLATIATIVGINSKW